MAIDPINSNAASSVENAPVQAAIGKSLNENDFLKIFMKQMTMQSPDKPLDSGEMMQQMSQLTALESNKSLKKAIEEMNRSIGQSQVMNATQMIGKRVAVASEVSPLSEKDGLKGSIVVPPGVNNVAVNIMDQNNTLVKKMMVPITGSGVVDFSWDGKNEAGEAMKPGFYKIAANGQIKGKDESLPTAGFFNVNSVTMDRQSSGVVLNVDGLGGIGMNEIIKYLG